MYAFGDLEKLAGLRPQIVRLAEGAGHWEPVAVPGAPSQDYHFEQIMSWMLAPVAPAAASRGSAT